MIHIGPYTDGNGDTFLLRGVEYRDVFTIAEILEDKPDIGDGAYSLNFASRDVTIWRRENHNFKPLPTGPLLSDMQALTWAFTKNGEMVGMVRIVYWFAHAQIHWLGIHPSLRGQGLATTLVLMLMRNIGHLGETTVSFEALETAPAVDALASKLELVKGEERVGKSGQTLTSYQFVSTEQAERISKDPESQIDVSIAEVAVRLPDASPKQPPVRDPGGVGGSPPPPKEEPPKEDQPVDDLRREVLPR